MICTFSQNCIKYIGKKANQKPHDLGKLLIEMNYLRMLK